MWLVARQTDKKLKTDENGKERQNFSLPFLWVNDFFYNFPVY